MKKIFIFSIAGLIIFGGLFFLFQFPVTQAFTCDDIGKCLVGTGPCDLSAMDFDGNGKITAGDGMLCKQGKPLPTTCTSDADCPQVNEEGIVFEECNVLGQVCEWQRIYSYKGKCVGGTCTKGELLHTGSREGKCWYDKSKCQTHTHVLISACREGKCVRKMVPEWAAAGWVGCKNDADCVGELVPVNVCEREGKCVTKMVPEWSAVGWVGCKADADCVPPEVGIKPTPPPEDGIKPILPTPSIRPVHIDSIKPDHGSAGDLVTLKGSNFWVSLGNQYIKGWESRPWDCHPVYFGKTEMLYNRIQGTYYYPPGVKIISCKDTEIKLFAPPGSGPVDVYMMYPSTKTETVTYGPSSASISVCKCIANAYGPCGGVSCKTLKSTNPSDFITPGYGPHMVSLRQLYGEGWFVAGDTSKYWVDADEFDEVMQYTSEDGTEYYYPVSKSEGGTVTRTVDITAKSNSVTFTYPTAPSLKDILKDKGIELYTDKPAYQIGETIKFGIKNTGSKDITILGMRAATEYRHADNRIKSEAYLYFPWSITRSVPDWEKIIYESGVRPQEPRICKPIEWNYPGIRNYAALSEPKGLNPIVIKPGETKELTWDSIIQGGGGNCYFNEDGRLASPGYVSSRALGAAKGLITGGLSDTRINAMGPAALYCAIFEALRKEGLNPYEEGLYPYEYEVNFYGVGGGGTISSEGGFWNWLKGLFSISRETIQPVTLETIGGIRTTFRIVCPGEEVSPEVVPPAEVLPPEPSVIPETPEIPGLPPESQPYISYTVGLHQGWNMISTPVLGEIPLSKIQENCTLATWQGHFLHYYNGKNWETPNALVPGAGYYVYAVSACSFTVRGDAYQFSNYLLGGGGWNMIAGSDSTLEEIKGDCTFKEAQGEKIWYYDGSGWTHPQTLERGKGYFVYPVNDCHLSK